MFLELWKQEVGLALAINAVFSISSTWITSFLNLDISYQKKKRGHCEKLFNFITKITIYCINWSFPWNYYFYFLDSIDHYLIFRLPSFNQFLLIASVTFINTYILSLTIFMRAHKQEPMLDASIIQATLMIVVLWNAFYGIDFLLISYNIINLFIAIWATIKLKKYF